MSVDKMSAEKELEQWLAVRRKGGLEINPETAEVDWCYAANTRSLRCIPRAT
jgi:hypothetical protein